MSQIIKEADSVTLVLNGYAFNSFGTGDILTLTPVNAFTSQINSSDGGVTINKRTDHDVYDLTISIQKYSSDDVFLNSLINSQTFEAIEGSLKEAFTRDGTAGIESWSLTGGSILTKPTNTKNDTDGNAVLEYVIRFRSATRSL